MRGERGKRKQMAKSCRWQLFNKYAESGKKKMGRGGWSQDGREPK